MYVDASPGQESQLFHVLIYQPQLLLSLTVAAARPTPPRLLLFYSYIIFFFMFSYDPTVATDSVCSSQYSHFPERCQLPIVEQVTTECDERFRYLVFFSLTKMRPPPKATNFFHIGPHIPKPLKRCMMFCLSYFYSYLFLFSFFLVFLSTLHAKLAWNISY